MIGDHSFNSRAPRGARRQAYKAVMASGVSIHVPLAEHDSNSFRKGFGAISFNSRAPRGARQRQEVIERFRTGFNSRAPRGARRSRERSADKGQSFNSRAPRGARRLYRIDSDGSEWVSIHVPLAEHDAGKPAPGQSEGRFNSRAPRGARPDAEISCCCPRGFNSRAPRGARPSLLTLCYYSI